MTTYIALLRAINVGGTGLLAMADLKTICLNLGFTNPRTYIQSGNVVFESNLLEAAVLLTLQKALHAKIGKPIDVMVRTTAELRSILNAVPFQNAEPNKVYVVFLSGAPPAEANRIAGPAGEQIVTGTRELYVLYPDGMGKSKLKLPLGKLPTTARNLNTVAKLVDLAAG
jgi:uncharacterized protein (DUF1697 family)